MAFLGYMGYRVNKSMKMKKKQALVVPVEQNVDVVGPLVGSPGMVLDAHASLKVTTKPSREDRPSILTSTAPPTSRHSLDTAAVVEYGAQQPSKYGNPSVLAGLLEDSPTFRSLKVHRGGIVGQKSDDPWL